MEDPGKEDSHQITLTLDDLLDVGERGAEAQRESNDPDKTITFPAINVLSIDLESRRPFMPSEVIE